ncbi:MAG: hypothetical protein ABI466_09065 [Chloroflexota bacterium]
MAPDWLLDVGVAPEAALARLEAAINQRPRRAFGVLKTQNEFIGAIAQGRFEVWERRQRAVHAVGLARPKRGGTRIEASFVIPPLTRGLLVAFCVLYVLVVLGIASQPPDPALSAQELVIAAVGAAVTGALFYGAARRQRRDLAGFLETVFKESRHP